MLVALLHIKVLGYFVCCVYKIVICIIGIYVLKIPLICCDVLVLRLDSTQTAICMYTQQIPFHRSVVKFMM